MAGNIFPDVPFQANVISTNAHAYSPDSTRDWGIVPATHRNNIKIIAKGVYYLVGEPLWENGRQWRVPPDDIELVIIEPPPPDPDTITYQPGDLELVTPNGIYKNSNAVTLTKV